MKTTPEIDQQIYELARGYLPGLKIPGVTPELIEKYLNPLSLHAKPASKEELYYRLLESAQEAGMKAGVIGGSIDGVKNLACVLDNFDPDAVLAKHGDNWNDILDQIEKVLKPRGQIRKREQSIWPRYCRTIISSARFLEQFESAGDFYNWADFFDKDERARASLPMLMDREIDGLGFALSCNFLKELGYVAGNANVTPYNVDKTFWLIGSGYFYDDPAIGSDGRIGRRHKQDFIEYARSKILLGQ